MEQIITETKNSNWDDFFNNDLQVTSDFMEERKDSPAQIREENFNETV